MIRSDKPVSYNAVPTPFADLISTGSRDLYAIELSLQRPYVWDSNTIESICKELVDIFSKNILDCKKKNVYDKCYIELDEIICSEVDEHNKNDDIFKTNGLKVHSIVEGSQRVRTMAVIFMFLLFLSSFQKEEEYTNLDDFKNSDDEFKLRILGSSDSNELDELIKWVLTESTDKIHKSLNKINLDKYRRKFSNTNEKNMKELFFYVGKLIYNGINEFNLDVDKCISILLDNCFVFKRQVPKEEKIQTFVTCNRLVVPMSEEHLYPKLIINKVNGDERKKVNDAYNRFIEVIKKIEEKNVYINTKGGLKAELFIETNVLNLQLSRRGIKQLAYRYRLGDYDYGLEATMNKGYHLNTCDDIIEYFSECKMYAEFILSSLSRKEDKTMNTYYFNNVWNNGSNNGLWWSFYTPCYVMCCCIAESDKRMLVNEFLYKSYIQFILSYSSGVSNRDSYSNLLYKLTDMIIHNLYLDFSLFKNKCVSILSEQINYNNNSWKYLTDNVNEFSYINKGSKMGIKCILLAFEKYIIDKYNFSDEELYNIWVKKSSCDLDHLFPNNLLDRNNETLYIEGNRLGNFVLLESNLNQNKSDNVVKNNKAYCQSKFISTNLLSNDFICNISNTKKDLLSKDEYIIRYNEDILNNPNIDLLRNRKIKLIDFIFSYIRIE